MTRDQMLSDAYERLTSRKFLGFLLVLFFAIWNWHAGRLTDIELQQAITAAFTVYGIAEGMADFATNWRSTPDTTVRTTVNTSTEAPPTPEAPTIAPAATTRPKRPSRAKPKPLPAILTEPVVAVPAPRRPRPRPATDLEVTP